MARVIGRPPRGLRGRKRRVDGLTGFTGDACQNANEADPGARLARNDLALSSELPAGAGGAVGAAQRARDRAATRRTGDDELAARLRVRRDGVAVDALAADLHLAGARADRQAGARRNGAADVGLL